MIRVIINKVKKVGLVFELNTQGMAHTRANSVCFTKNWIKFGAFSACNEKMKKKKMSEAIFLHLPFISLFII